MQKLFEVLSSVDFTDMGKIFLCWFGFWFIVWIWQQKLLIIRVTQIGQLLKCLLFIWWNGTSNLVGYSIINLVHTHTHICEYTQNKSDCMKICKDEKTQVFQKMILFIEIFSNVLVFRPSSGHVNYFFNFKMLITYIPQWRSEKQDSLILTNISTIKIILQRTCIFTSLYIFTCPQTHTQNNETNKPINKSKKHSLHPTHISN